MSVYTKQTLIESFPAYDVFVRDEDRGFINITSADRLGLNSGKGFYKEFSPGSVVSYALDYNECPMEAVARATERKHPLHWINACGTALTSHKQAKRNLVAVFYGMRVRFEGKLFTIERDHNDNLRFAPVVAAEKKVA